MGFGILFIGYFLTFGAAFYAFHPLSAAGCVVMAVGLWILSRYCRAFRPAIYPVGVLGLLQCCTSALKFMGYGTPSEEESGLVGEIVYEWLLYVILIAQTVFFVLLLRGIIKLAEDVELIEIKRSALKNLIVYGIYAVLWGLFFPLGERVYEISPQVFGVTYAFLNLLSIIWFVMMVWLIFKCFNNIIPEEKAVSAEEAEAAVPGTFKKIGNTVKNLLTRIYTPREVREMYKNVDRNKDDEE